MKKLVMAMLVAVAAVAVNAATVRWQSGTLRGAASADGGWGTGTIANASKDGDGNITWYAAVYLIDSATYATLTTQEKVWDYVGATSIAGITTGTGVSAQLTKTSGSSANLDTDATVGTTYYAAVIAAYHDTALNQDFYLASRATIDGSTITNAGNTYNVANLLSSVGSASGGGWQAVPEPTSGLLMLLGMAGLALRRKRA